MQKMCFDFLNNFCLKHVSFCEDFSEILSQMYISLRVQYLLFLSYFKETLNFSTDFRKILKYKISLKSVQWEVTCFIRTQGRTDRQTDMIKPIVAFRNSANTPQ